MENRLMTLFHIVIVIMAFLGISLAGGCGESEMGKALTDSVKKVIGEEVSKKTDEAKKQFDQFLNQGQGKGEKDGGKGASGESDEKGSQQGSGGEKD